MPNWNQNRLTLRGTPEQIDFALSKIGPVEDGRQSVDFGVLIPMPADPEGDWYDWCNNNWGTKWNVGSVGVHVERGEDSVLIVFHTAWGPPLPWFEELFQAMPPGMQMHVQTWEAGMAFGMDCFYVMSEEPSPLEYERHYGFDQGDTQPPEEFLALFDNAF